MPKRLPEKRDVQQGENEKYDPMPFQGAPLKAGQEIAERIK